MEGEMKATLRALVRDAATYLTDKVVDEVISGPEGGDYPKVGYASGISPGEKGFIGVDSGGLRRSIQLRKDNDLKWDIFSENVVANYNKYVDSWAKEKYGKGFFDITLELYSQGVLNLFSQELARFVRAVTNNQVYQYRNPFPS